MPLPSIYSASNFRSGILCRAGAMCSGRHYEMECWSGELRNRVPQGSARSPQRSDSYLGTHPDHRRWLKVLVVRFGCRRGAKQSELRAGTRNFLTFTLRVCYILLPTLAPLTWSDICEYMILRPSRHPFFLVFAH